MLFATRLRRLSLCCSLLKISHHSTEHRNRETCLDIDICWCRPLLHQCWSRSRETAVLKLIREHYSRRIDKLMFTDLACCRSFFSPGICSRTLPWFSKPHARDFLHSWPTTAIQSTFNLTGTHCACSQRTWVRAACAGNVLDPQSAVVQQKA